MTTPNGRTPRTALVIGSGSVKCAAAIGLLNVLQREGIPLDMVVGCSGGSIYAATIALGLPADTIAAMTAQLWTREITSRRRRRAWLQIMLPGLFGFDEHFGMVDDTLVMKRLRAAFGGQSFADTVIPLSITATDFNDGAQVVLTSGSLVDAIRGSIAIPYIFAPYPVGDHLLVDGYLSDPMPVGVAIKEGADVIIAMGFDSPYQSRVNSLFRYTFQISSIMSNNLFNANYAFHNLAHHSEVIPIIPEFEERIRLFDTQKIPQIIAAGERAAEEQLPYLRRLYEEARP
ncbi:MAG: patatin-like phospholipase family protein [Candidatus Promineifilaceae bacterium]|nr:patatin-like phospholipase family protein [Candidatus Promineifilaceae bacterium]